MPTYNRADLAFERGEGARLWTVDGRRFLDFGAGIATSSIGHGHPHLVKAIAEQAARVMHVSNLYRVPQAEELAARHVAASFADSVFFCNSGAEANEGMIKAVRKYHAENGHPERFGMICFDGAFHGRTLAMLAATGNEKYLAGFGPPVEGFNHVPFDNMNAVRRAIMPQTAGIMIEPIQGEGGVRPAPLRFLKTARRSATNSACCWRLTKCRPAWGVRASSGRINGPASSPTSCPRPRASAAASRSAPILAKEHVAKHLKPGTHGTTYGGGPLACAAGLRRDGRDHGAGLPRRRRSRGAPSVERAGRPRRPPSDGGRGRAAARACCVGIKLTPEVSNGEMQTAAVAEGLLTVAAGMNVLRLAPPLIITEAEADEAIELLDRACRRMTPSKAKVAAK